MGITQRWKAAGETKEHTEWANVEAWGKLGEIAQQYLKKGSLVFVEGRLKTDRYEDKGETKYFTKVVSQSIQFLSDSRARDALIEQESPLEEEIEAPAL
jgi:single-strand DNA-binding protein